MIYSTPNLSAHKGHDLRYVGTDKDDHDGYKCRTCNPSLWRRLLAWR